MPDLTRELQSRIILSVCGLGGEEFFREVVRHLAELTGAPYAFVLALDRPGGDARVGWWPPGTMGSWSRA